jgi:hypothetical protein
MKLLKLALNMFVTLALIFGTNGCMTSNVIHDASVQSDKDSNGKQVVYKKANPAMYLLLPVAIPADIATSPFQAMVGAFSFTYVGATMTETN